MVYFIEKILTKFIFIKIHDISYLENENESCLFLNKRLFLTYQFKLGRFLLDEKNQIRIDKNLYL